MATYNAGCTALLNVPKPTAPVAQQRIWYISSNRAFSYLTQIWISNIGNPNVRKMIHSESGFSTLFFRNQYALDVRWSERQCWISSRQSVLTTHQQRLRVACLLTFMGNKPRGVVFNSLS